MKSIKASGLMFPAVMWLSSRTIIWLAMLVVAPLSHSSSGNAVNFGLGVFDAWDSGHYRTISTSGYEYVNGKGNIAFFPLFPLILCGFNSIGLPFEIAGVLINNLAFLAALYYLYLWVQKVHDTNAARWAVAVAAWFPASMFAGVIYTEGLYLLLSIAALRAFDLNSYGWTAFWGACATASRPTGMALIPAFVLAAWKQRKPPIAYLAGLATVGGVGLYSIYCGINFGDPLAFINAQKAWRGDLGFQGEPWWKMLMQITIGTANYKYGGIKDPTHPILFLIIAGCGYLLWQNRQKFSPAKVDYGFGLLLFAFWLLAGDPLLNTATFFGSAYLLWSLRRNLTPVTLFYGCAGLGMLLMSGGTFSLNRLIYGIISPTIALGITLSRNQRWGYMTLGFFTIVLFAFSLRFAQKLWTG
jgi:Gpi18-like mannosyltransferase